MRKFVSLIVLAVLIVTNSYGQDSIIPISYHGHIYLKGNIENADGNFLFDTGALSLYFDSTFYANKNFDYKNTIVAYIGGAGSSRQKAALIRDTVNFKFGEYSYTTPDVAILQLKPILGDYADGILGVDYFKQSVMEINYTDQYIKLHKKVNPEDIADYKKIKMTKRDKKLFIPASVQINDKLTIKGEVLFDIGSGRSISITRATAKKYNLDKQISQKVPYFTKYGGIGGESSSYNFRTNSVQIEDYILDEVVMDYSDDKSGALSSDKYWGILGNDILNRFDLIIDFVNNDLYLKPNQNFAKPYNFSKLSFSYVDRSQTKNAWIVTGLYKNRDAQNAGLEIDDQIIEVNGVKIQDIKFDKQVEFFKNIDEVDLTIIRNGETTKIQFALSPIL